MRLARLLMPQVRQWQRHMSPLIPLALPFMPYRLFIELPTHLEADAAVGKERDWQYEHLLELRAN